MGAVESERIFNRAALYYLNVFGSPENIADLVEWLRDNGFADRAYKWEKSKTLTPQAVRNRLKNTFGLTGKPGRKPKG